MTMSETILLLSVILYNDEVMYNYLLLRIGFLTDRPLLQMTKTMTI